MPIGMIKQNFVLNTSQEAFLTANIFKGHDQTALYHWLKFIQNIMG